MIPTKAFEIIVDLRHRLEEMERRFENRERTGKISHLDMEKGLARVQFDVDQKSGQPFLSPWVPWKEVAMGAIKTHFPPAIGEQVKFVSESGDMTDGMIDTSIPSTANPRPHDQAAEGVITVGNMRLHYKDGLCDIKVGGKRMIISGSRIDLNPA